MLTCRQVIDTLGDYLERAPGGSPLVDEIETHLRLCPGCLELWESYRLVSRIPPKAEEIVIPEALANRIQQALDGLIAAKS